MTFNIDLQYRVNTPPLVPEKLQGMRITQSQSQYKFSNFEAVAGDDSIIISGTNSITGVECGVFLTGVENNYGDISYKKPTAATDKIFGFSYLNFQRALIWSESLQCFVYTEETDVTVVTEGDYVGHLEDTSNPLDDVYQRISADGGNTRIGALSSSAGTGKIQIAGAKFLEKMTAPGKTNISLRDLY